MAENNRYTNAVAHYSDGLHISPGCAGEQCEHADGDVEHYCEASFSSCQCDSCGSTLAGDRLPATAFIPTEPRPDSPPMGEVIELSICVDCVMYWANGDVPDVWYSSPPDWIDNG